MNKALVAGFAASLFCVTAADAGGAPEWRGLGANPQHQAQANATAQNFTKVHWSAPVDLHPLAGHARGSGAGEILIHYGSPMITAANTVIFPVKQTLNGGFHVEAHNGTTGALLWSVTSNYVLPPHNWTPEFPAHLTAQNVVAYALAGGVVALRTSPDSATGTIAKRFFYGKGTYTAAPATYNANVVINTPITADSTGNLFFGFSVLGSTPAALQSGIARIARNGTGSWVSAATAAGDTGISEVATTCAPALSNDGKTIYIAVSNGTSGYLVALDAATLVTKGKVALTDPSSGQPAWVDDDSSAAPTVGPDGDVYYGVLENPFPSHNDRGWLLHFDSRLKTAKTPGSFGWDNTPSIVPASAVPSYKGASSYLIMSKYNNYYGIGSGDGHNRIAILDPTATQSDAYATATVMQEVITKLAPTHFPGEPAGALYEWCIDTAAVDVPGKVVIANSEDGHVYRWDLTTNTISQSIFLNAPRAEAYTPTVVGPDGTVYAVNNAILYAIGN